MIVFVLASVDNLKRVQRVVGVVCFGTLEDTIVVGRAVWPNAAAGLIEEAEKASSAEGSWSWHPARLLIK